MNVKAGEDAAPPAFWLDSSSASQVFPRGKIAYSPPKQGALVGNITVAITPFCINTSSSCTILPCVCMTLLEMFNTYGYDPGKKKEKVIHRTTRFGKISLF